MWAKLGDVSLSVTKAAEVKLKVNECEPLMEGANAEEHLDLGGDGLFELEFM